MTRFVTLPSEMSQDRFLNIETRKADTKWGQEWHNQTCALAFIYLIMFSLSLGVRLAMVSETDQHPKSSSSVLWLIGCLELFLFICNFGIYWWLMYCSFYWCCVLLSWLVFMSYIWAQPAVSVLPSVLLLQMRIAHMISASENLMMCVKCGAG